MTFYAWIQKQRDKWDAMGNLAWFASRDPRMRRSFSSIKELVDYLRGRGASDEAVRAASESWIAWRGSIGMVNEKPARREVFA